MFNFIRQCVRSIYNFVTSIYQYFTGQAPEPIISYEPLYLAEFLDVSIEPQLTSGLLPTNLTPELLLSQSHHAFPAKINLHEYLPQHADTLFWRDEKRHMRQQEREMRQQAAREREQWENPFSDWWRNTRLYQRNTQFGVAVSLPENELYAQKIDQFVGVDVPEEFICGISAEIMTNPVYDPNHPQQKYDYLVLETWLYEHEKNPYTGRPLLTQNLVYDEVLKAQIDEFMAETISAQRRMRFN